MTTASVNRAASLLLIIFGFFALAENLSADDFGRIVRHIEAEYHVHRNYRFLMSFAGVVVKYKHVGGVKVFKIAIFEDQHLSGPELDNQLDELVQRLTHSEFSDGDDVEDARWLRAHTGKIGFLQLGWAYQGSMFLCEVSTEWYERYQRLLEMSEDFGGIPIDEPDQDDET